MVLLIYWSDSGLFCRLTSSLENLVPRTFGIERSLYCRGVVIRTSILKNKICKMFSLSNLRKISALKITRYIYSSYSAHDIPTVVSHDILIVYI